MRVEMINIDILNDKAMYYNIFTEKKNGRYFIIEHTGKIGNKGEIPEPKTYCVFDSDYPFYYRKWATDEKLSKYNKMADVLKNEIEAIKKNINIQNTITTYLNL